LALSEQSFNVKLGFRIKSRRLKLQLSRQELAKRADISDKFLYDIEVGNKGLSAKTLFSLARSLNTSTDWLIGQSPSLCCDCNVSECALKKGDGIG